jgi:hypothetical protein
MVPLTVVARRAVPLTAAAEAGVLLWPAVLAAAAGVLPAAAELPELPQALRARAAAASPAAPHRLIFRM